jgi:hypothetical protein
MKYFKFLVFLLCSSISALASAEAMRGIKDIAIVVENPSDDTVKCQVSRDMLDASVRIPLSNTKLKVVDRSLSYIYVNVSMMELNDSFCIGSIRISFNKYSVSESDFGSFWIRVGTISTTKINSRKRISDLVESHTKEFIAAWLKANPN